MTWGGSEQEPLSTALHGSETRNLTLTYATGSFIFEILESTKQYWAKGEQIKIHYKVKNNGNVSSTASIKIYDGTTLLVTWLIAALNPGYSFEALEATDYKLKMPDHDWTLQFVLEP